MGRLIAIGDIHGYASSLEVLIKKIAPVSHDTLVVLGDFVDQQLEVLREHHAEEVESGLAIDVLAYHTTALVTAGTRGANELSAQYRHVADRLPGLLQSMVDAYLLSDSGGADTSGVRRYQRFGGI